MLGSSTHQAITPQMVQIFAATARKRMHIDGGGYRRDHLRTFAQREVFIKGSKDELLRGLVAIGGGISKEMGVPSSVLNGGGGGIRTPGGREPSTVFKTAAIDRSATPPTSSPPTHSIAGPQRKSRADGRYSARERGCGILFD